MSKLNFRRPSIYAFPVFDVHIWKVIISYVFLCENDMIFESVTIDSFNVNGNNFRLKKRTDKIWQPWLLMIQKIMNVFILFFNKKMKKLVEILDSCSMRVWLWTRRSSKNFIIRIFVLETDLFAKLHKQIPISTF